MEKLSDLQLSEIARLLDERSVSLRMRLHRHRLLFSNHPEWKDEILQEIDVIDSIFELF